MNHIPTPNDTEVSRALPQPDPQHFDVATIKLTDPQFSGIRIQTPPNGTINIQGVTLGYLLQTIWFVTPEMIVGAPKWVDTDRWDIAGKIASEPGSPPQMDMDSLLPAVRGLIEDRFQLQTHMEEREAPAYTLTALKPRMQRADPANRAGCKEGPGDDGKDPRVANPARSRLVACRNVTMAEFAQLLPGIANALNPVNGQIRSAVADATQLSGEWDFTLNFTPGLGTAPPAQGIPAASDRPADPNGTISIFEAIQSQLGLKLAITKRRTQVVVIDRIERPREN